MSKINHLHNTTTKVSSELIQGIQLQLNYIGYKVGKLMVFDEKTKSAIKHFQKNTNITVDGLPSLNLSMKLGFNC